MNAITFYEQGTNLREAFKRKLIKSEKYIESNFGEFQKNVVRFSPAISASINSQHFIVEVQVWEYLADGKPVAYLESMIDIKGEYFDISVDSSRYL